VGALCIGYDLMTTDKSNREDDWRNLYIFEKKMFITWKKILMLILLIHACVQVSVRAAMSSTVTGVSSFSAVYILE
jgi:hypothetical protein